MVDTNRRDTIQDISVKLTTNTENQTKENTIFITGSNGVGKSTIINQFLERNESTRPTLALEYSFGRRTASGHGIFKEICNIWELGTLINSNNLVEIALRSHDLTNFSAIIVLDLSRPDRLWTDLECALKELRNATNKIPNCDHLIEKSRQRIGLNHPDLNTLEIFPFPIVLVGGKYDLFENQDPEIKKHVCRCLRSVSHAVGGALIFYSIKHANSTKLLRDTLNCLGFGNQSQAIRITNTDYNRPIIIPFGEDSWEKIGVLPTNSERIGHTYSTHINQVKHEQIKSNISYNPATDLSFREVNVDDIRMQKDDELFGLIRNKEMKFD